MKRAILTIAALTGLCMAGAESGIFAAQVWLNIGGSCLFCVGMINLAKTLKDGGEA